MNLVKVTDTISADGIGGTVTFLSNRFIIESIRIGKKVCL